MKNSTLVALIAGGATVIAAVIAISPKFLPGGNANTTGRNNISIGGASSAAIVQGSENVTIQQTLEVKKEESSVKIVSTTADQSELDVSVIDIKLRNNGDNSAFLKELSLVNVESAILMQCSRCPGAPVYTSERYDISFRDMKAK